MLIGAWARLKPGEIKVLDVGTGTGLIALMIAQRSKEAIITGIEIDEDSFCEAEENINNTEWKNRIELLHANFNIYAKESRIKFDLIVSNPPFFDNGIVSPEENRANARHNLTLTLENFMKNASYLLNEDGVLSIILPYDQESKMIECAMANGLFLNRICYVKGSPQVKIKRILCEFSKIETECIKDELVIEEERHKYTDDYIRLTKEFYLKM